MERSPLVPGLPSLRLLAFIRSLAILLAPLLGSCATSSIERLSEEPRAVSVPGTGAYTWDEARGWVQPERGSWGAPEAIRRDADRAYAIARWADALAGYLVIDAAVQREADDGALPPQRGSDLSFRIAECYYRLGHYSEALEYYRRVYRTDYPPEPLVQQALQRVYDIALAYLRGDAICDFAGLIPYACEDFGITILTDPEEGLLVEYPMVSFLDTALMEIADYFNEEGQFPEAVPLYDRVAEDIESEFADEAEFKAAVATFEQVRGVDYDQRTLLEAERRFHRYLEKIPSGRYAEKARVQRDAIREMQSSKDLKIAKFYLRESQPQACSLYLESVLRNYPNSAAAREAREIQKQLDRAKDDA